MKSFSFASLIFAVLLGVAVAFIRPAQPVQIAPEAAAPTFVMCDGLDNPSVTADPNIHPARKCEFVRLIGLVCFVPVPLSCFILD